MKLSPLVIGIFGISSCSLIHASALDQSGQSILPFLETGHYAEVSIATDLVSDATNLNTGNMGNSFQYYNAALKLQLPPTYIWYSIHSRTS